MEDVEQLKSQLETHGNFSIIQTWPVHVATVACSPANAQKVLSVETGTTKEDSLLKWKTEWTL